jgi:hypothetical protein
VGNRDEFRRQSGASGQIEEIFLSLTARQKQSRFHFQNAEVHVPCADPEKNNFTVIFHLIKNQPTGEI